MPKILLAPSYGNPTAQRHFDTTVSELVRFESGKLASLLTEEELATLLRSHPDGRAHFWGARDSRSKQMAALTQGDVVLFTGDNKVKASAEIGYLFRNRAFADALWRYDPSDDSFVHVYSVMNVRHINRSKEELLSLEGFKLKDPLTGQRLVKPDLVPQVLRAFNIGTSVAEAMLETAIAETLERRSRVTPVEKVRKQNFTRTTAAGTTTAYRVESALVLEYQNFCGPDQLRSFVTSSGRRADLYREDGDDVEVIEAKSLANHGKLREAVAQLLDYATHSPKPVTRLTGLFPQVPDEEGLAFLHRLGIDVVYFDGETFIRRPAPDARRNHMLPVWRST